MIKPVAPCKDCPDRRSDPNCHGYCDKYFLFLKLNHQYKQEQFLNKEIDVFHSVIKKRHKNQR